MNSFAKRCISGVILAAVTILALLKGGIFTTLIVAFFGICGIFEIYRALGFLKAESEKKTPAVIGIVGTVIMYILNMFTDYRLLIIISIFVYLIIVLAIYVFKYGKYTISDVALLLFGFVYTSTAALLIIAIRERLDNGIYLVWMALFPAVFSDIFAYCVGMLIGKHKLAPVVSPKKSIEGSVGGVIGSGLCTGLYGYYLSTQISVSTGFVAACVIIGLVCGAISQVGDLAASAIKREVGIKDYGKIIPGHGGILDRIDSIIYITPLVFAGAVILTTYFM